MALGSTMYVFTVELADADRGIYETLEIRAAQHPSETPDYLLTRVLAYCLEYREGISFAKGGVSDRDEPTLYARDLTGALQLWVEVGIVAPERLHIASKAAPEVKLYCHKEAHLLQARLKGASIHRKDELRTILVPRPFMEALLRHLDRRLQLSLTVADGHLYCSVGNDSFDCVLETLRLED
ncbi:MAG TPA: YaeQ family protein [Hyphomicrobiales bacterium]|nr:YaeQ family protein [Hyphomicrobiales bacterium]